MINGEKVTYVHRGIEKNGIIRLVRENFISVWDENKIVNRVLKSDILTHIPFSELELVERQEKGKIDFEKFQSTMKEIDVLMYRKHVAHINSLKKAIHQKTMAMSQKGEK